MRLRNINELKKAKIVTDIYIRGYKRLAVKSAFIPSYIRSELAVIIVKVKFIIFISGGIKLLIINIKFITTINTRGPR